MKGKSATNQSEKPIQVFVRVRPLNQSEKNSRSLSIVNVNNGREVVVKERPVEKLSRTFTFDKAFGPESKQVDVYKRVVKPLIDEVLAGYNCTVFAYGQTGTGKTFTMEGAKSTNCDVSWEDDPLTGIIPRSLSHLFDELRIRQLENTVRVSFLELYNEELFDLLSPVEDASKLRLFEDSNKKGSVIIQNLEEVPVSNKTQVYNIMEKGSQKRQTAATLMNAHSSRSHTIFSITVHIKETSDKGEELFKIGKLNLVDLAGSENIGRSGAVDKRAREAGNINQSLLTLGRVITSLVEKAPHIPYRESKLTRLLQDSLGGRTKTSIIATISPALCNFEETLSTLEYAARAKNITNRPEINQKLTKKAFLKEYEEEIDRLKRDLMASRDRNGIFVDPDNYTKMTLQIDEQEKEISENLATIKALRAEMEKREAIFEELSASNEKAKEEIERRKQSCKETREKLKKVTIDRNEHKHLKERHMDTEKKLHEQAQQLLSVADVATTDTVKLHEKIDRKGSVETNNVTMCNQFCSTLQSYFSEAKHAIQEQADNEIRFFNLLKGAISNSSKMQDDCLDQIRNQLKGMCQLLSERMSTFTNVCQNSRKEKHAKLIEELEELKLKLNSNNNLLDETIYKGIVPQLNDVLDHLSGGIEEFLVKLGESGEKTNKDIQRLNTGMKTLKKSCKEIFENHLNVLKSIESKEDELDELEGLLLKVNESKKENSKKMIQEIQKAVSDFEATEDKLDQEYTEVLKSRIAAGKKSRSLLKNLSSSIQKSVKDCEPNFAEIISLANIVEESFNHQQVATVEKLETLNKSGSEHLTSVKTNIENLSSVSLESQRIFDLWSEKFDKSLIESDAKETQFEKEEEQSLLKDVTEQVEASEAVLKDFIDTRETALAELENNIDDGLNCSGKLRSEISENLELQNSLVKKFLQEDFKTDIPTGFTPQRREFNYPHELTATSPHEAILARYRATITHELSFNDSLDSTVAPDEENQSSSSESSSSSASASSTSLDQKENDSDYLISPQPKQVNQASISKKRILGENVAYNEV